LFLTNAITFVYQLSLLVVEIPHDAISVADRLVQQVGKGMLVTTAFHLIELFVDVLVAPEDVRARFQHHEAELVRERLFTDGQDKPCAAVVRLVSVDFLAFRVCRHAQFLQQKVVSREAELLKEDLLA